MEVQIPDMILTVVVLSFWFLFPIGLFLSVSHVDKNTDQLVRLDHLRHDSVNDVETDESQGEYEPAYRPPSTPSTDVHPH